MAGITTATRPTRRQSVDRPPLPRMAGRQSNVVSIDAFRTGKAYTVSQAARLAGTTPATVRRWLRGYDQPGHQMEPVFGGREADAEQVRRVSFLELVEIIVVAAFRRGSPGHPPVTLEKIRRAYQFTQKWLNLQYPFASLELVESGGHLLHEYDVEHPEGGKLVALDLHGQAVLPVPVSDIYKHQLEFGRKGDPFAVRWYPHGLEVPIVVDPHRAAGQPSVKGRNITVETLVRRKAAGETAEELAADYDLAPEVVEAILKHAA